jgi:oxygen-independent coproporphyrinogen-3 oxidase
MAGLYIHIPFCHSKCYYCDFYSTPNRAAVTQVVDTIIAEAEARKAEIAEPFKTVYIGGGTPSILPIEDLQRLLHLPLDLSQVIETTIEVNPEDVTLDRAEQWRNIGVNRISMGIQSFDDDQLKAIGRRHTAQDALAAVDNLRRAGIQNISCDLIYGLPGQSVESWHKSLTQLLELGLPHFSAYCLSYEPGTRLYASRQAGKVQEADDVTITQMYEVLMMEAQRFGYLHYEISNFCKPDCHSRHNSSYWDDTPYLGLGASAHSFDGKVRRFNPSNIQKYIATIPSFEVEDESLIDRTNDLIITGLRTSQGLDVNRISDLYRAEVLAAAKPYLATGQLMRRADRLIIPEKTWLIADAIMRDLIIDN